MSVGSPFPDFKSQVQTAMLLAAETSAVSTAAQKQQNQDNAAAVISTAVISAKYASVTAAGQKKQNPDNAAAVAKTTAAHSS